MKVNLPTPVVIGIIVVVMAVVGFFFVRSAVVEPPTPRPDLYGGPRAGASGAPTTAAKPETYPGQNGGGAVTPLNSGG